MRALFALALLVSVPALAAEPAAPAAKLSLDTPIETVMADPAGKAVIEANFPELPGLPMYNDIKGMSLSQLAPMSGGRMSDEALAKTKAGLEAIK